MEYLGPAGVTLFYVSDIAKAIGYDLGYVGHTWSLAMEEQFYLAAAVLLFLPRRFLVPAVPGIAGSVALQVVIVGWQDSVLAHFRLASVPLLGLPDRPRACSGATVGCDRCGHNVPLALSLTFMVYAIATSSVLWPSSRAASVARPLSWRPLVRVGELSYGLYLWHAIPVGLFMEPNDQG